MIYQWKLIKNEYYRLVLVFIMCSAFTSMKSTKNLEVSKTNEFTVNIVTIHAGKRYLIDLCYMNSSEEMPYWNWHVP